MMETIFVQLLLAHVEATRSLEIEAVNRNVQCIEKCFHIGSANNCSVHVAENYLNCSEMHSVYNLLTLFNDNGSGLCG